MPDGAKVRVSLPSVYGAVDLANLLATMACKRIVFETRQRTQSPAQATSPPCKGPPEEDCGETIDTSQLLVFTETKLRALGMTALVRDDEIIFVEGTPQKPGPEPTGASRVVLDPNRPEPPQSAAREVPKASADYKKKAAARTKLIRDQISCSGSTCTIDTAGLAPLVDDRLLSSSVRLLADAEIPGGLKLFGVRSSSLLGAVGVRNGSTLVTIDGTPAADVLISAKTPMSAFLEQLLSTPGTTTFQLETREGKPVFIDLVFR